MRRAFFVLFLLTASVVSSCATGGGGAKGLKRNDRGLKEFQKGNYQEAIRYFKEATERLPNDSVVWSNLGSAYFKGGNADEALKSLNRAAEIDPSNEYAVYWRSLAYYWKQDYNKAIVNAEKLIWSQQFRGEALRVRSWSYFNKGMYQKAIEDFNAYIELFPDNYGSLSCRGWSYYYSGNYGQAIEDFNQAISKMKPEDKSPLSDALRGKAFAYLGLGDAQTAAHLIETAKQAMDYSNNYDLTLIYYVSGDSTKAWKYRGGESFLGTQLEDYKSGALAGARVAGVTQGSPASNGGLMKGDVIVGFNGATVGSTRDYLNCLKPVKTGEIVEIVLLREGLEKRIPVKAASAGSMIESDPLIAPIMKQVRNRASGGEVPEIASGKVLPDRDVAAGGSSEDELE